VQTAANVLFGKGVNTGFTIATLFDIAPSITLETMGIEMYSWPIGIDFQMPVTVTLTDRTKNRILDILDFGNVFDLDPLKCSFVGVSHVWHGFLLRIKFYLWIFSGLLSLRH